MPGSPGKRLLPLVPALLALATGPAGLSAGEKSPLDWQLPRASLMLPFEKQTPIHFVTTKNPAEWNKLTGFWNPVREIATDPATGKKVERAAVKIKVPLGLAEAPPVPPENPLTVQRWTLGRDLYFDPILSSDGTVSCASCHAPQHGFTDRAPVSTGIFKQKGGMSAPTVMNTAYNALQFWDGRAASLEHQAHGPVGNPIEMFDGKGEPWDICVVRIRKKGDYTKRFRAAFGTDPTRDAATMAIAGYERTVLNGNSLHDRAEKAMQIRVVEEESGDFTIKGKDYARALKDAFAARDVKALAALKLDPVKDAGKVKEVGDRLVQGRNLFFGKARCALCHVGQNFTDNAFHNLGVGVKDGKIPDNQLGRYGALPTGHKNPEMVGAFKTPTLRGLVNTEPYMHDGSEKTLEEVVELYDRGGNPNPYLSTRMRDIAAEQAYLLSRRGGPAYKGPKVYTFGPDATPIVPFRLNLTPAEKADLVLFLRSLEGEVAPIVMDPTLPVPTVSAK